MQTSSIAQLKKELQNIPQPELAALCLRMAKFKKENKELLHYLLFEASDEEQYIVQAKQQIDELFAEINTTSVYFVKKTVRKILRHVNKLAKYSGLPQTNVTLLIYFLQCLNNFNDLFDLSPQLRNIYEGQLKKINKELSKLHEDLQYDFNKEIEALG